MLEVEMKFPVAEFGALERQLVAIAPQTPELLQEVDHYFNAPDRDFAQTDEALRLRRIGMSNFVTYKGPKRDAHTKTRTELEIPLTDGSEAAAQFSELLKYLHYRPVAIVPKQRRIYHLERDGFSLEVCLDDVEGLGHFAELEIQAPEDRLDAARAVLLETASWLGLAASERRSYLELLLERRGEQKT